MYFEKKHSKTSQETKTGSERTRYTVYYILVRTGSPRLTLIGKFPGHELDRFMENSSNKFHGPIQFSSNSGPRAGPISGKLIQSSIFEFWGMTQADFWKIHPQ